jgi:hypothetical protein
MITAAKLKQLSNINADQLTDLLLDSGYDCSDEPFINTYFEGMTTSGSNLNFIYQAPYAHVDGGLQYARIIVTYSSDTAKTSIEFEA